jgi:hypothetical protein
LLLTAAHLSFVKYQQTQHIGFWKHQAQLREKLAVANQGASGPARSPSALLDFDPDSLEIYRDYFSYPTYQKYLSYDLALNFRTDKDKPYVKEVLQKSLQETIRTSLIQKKAATAEEGIEAHDKGLTALIKGNLVNSLVDNFVKTIKVYKIINGTFQIDLNFIPKAQKEFGYDSELASNELINWSKKDSLFEELKREDVPFHQKVLETPVPSTSNTYQYKGGQITIWFKVMDLTPTLKLPSPTKRGVKGFIRLRRYYRAPELANTEPFVEDNDFRLNMVHFKSLKKKNKNGVSENFVTADIYKEFDLENPVPKLDRVELHFGKVLPDNFHKNSLIGRLFAYKEKTIETSELNLFGVLKYHDKEYVFESQINKLIFDFKTGEFSKKSKIRTTFKRSKLKGPQLGSAQHKVYNKLLEEHGLKLIESFNLGEIHSKFRGQR